MSDKEKWERRYRRPDTNAATPCRLLQAYTHLLPARGDALDLAAGRGANALLLARHGLNCQAWDISDTAMQALQHQAGCENLPLHCQVRDVTAAPPAANSFDLIVVSRFLHRPLCPAITAALRPGGLLFYQTFTVEKSDPRGPTNPDYLLRRNELLQLFPELAVVAYREEGLIGDTSKGIRNEAWLVAYKAGR
ncbi:MAG: class I SAM-dependent methyltransferase [Pseudomonadota bacterium]